MLQKSKEYTKLEALQRTEGDRLQRKLEEVESELEITVRRAKDAEQSLEESMKSAELANESAQRANASVNEMAEELEKKQEDVERLEALLVAERARKDEVGVLFLCVECM